MPTDSTSHAEYDAWLLLCNLLRASGAVSASDLASRTSARDTEGQRILAAIREWGDALKSMP